MRSPSGRPVHDRFAGTPSDTELKLLRLLHEAAFTSPPDTPPP